MADSTIHQCSICYGRTGTIDSQCPKCNGTGWQSQRDDVGRYEVVPTTYVVAIDECDEISGADVYLLQARILRDFTVRVKVVTDTLTAQMYVVSEAFTNATAAVQAFNRGITKAREAMQAPVLLPKDKKGQTRKDRREAQPWSKAQRNQPWNKKR